ncbi:MAG: hypothetical protein ACXWUP_06135 [Allosphingosinicella sp.]
MKQSLLYFVVAAMCALSAITSTLTGVVSALTALGVGCAAVALWLGLRHRSTGN